MFAVKNAHSTVRTVKITITFGNPRKLASSWPTKINAAKTTRLRITKIVIGSGTILNAASRVRARQPTTMIASAAAQTAR
jgi:hypothetical protein